MDLKIIIGGDVIALVKEDDHVTVSTNFNEQLKPSIHKNNQIDTCTVYRDNEKNKDILCCSSGENKRANFVCLFEIYSE